MDAHAGMGCRADQAGRVSPAKVAASIQKQGQRVPETKKGATVARSPFEVKRRA